MGAVVTNPDGVDKTGAEDMTLFQRDNLPLGDGMLQDVAKRIRLGQRGVVKTIGAEQVVLFGKFLVDSNGEEILVYNLLADPRKVSNVAGNRSSRCG